MHEVHSSDIAAAGTELAQVTDTALKEVNAQQQWIWSKSFGLWLFSLILKGQQDYSLQASRRKCSGLGL